MGKPAWLTKQKSIVQALIDLGNDDFYRPAFLNLLFNAGGRI